MPVIHFINNYKTQTSFSNIYKCCVCKCNILESSSEVVEESTDMDLNREDRRFEKWHKCKTCTIGNGVNEDGNLPAAPIEIGTKISLNKLMYYPVLENCMLNSFEPNDNIEVGDNDDRSVDSDENPALDALIELLDAESQQLNDNQADNNEGNGDHEEIKYVTVFSPNSSKIDSLFRNKIQCHSNLQKIIYSGSEFQQEKISIMYSNQVNKYLSKVNFFNGTIANQEQRLIHIESCSNDHQIRGSDRYNSQIFEDLTVRMSQLGQFCLKIAIHLNPSNDETLASALLQQNSVVSVSLNGDQTNHLQRSYFVHSHSSETDCQNNCDKVPLADYLQIDDNITKHLKNKLVPTFLLTATKKMEEIVTIIRCTSSPLHSEDYFFQLVFHLNGNITIQGILWPVMFRAYNVAVAEKSFSGEIDLEIEKKLLKDIEESVFTTSDLQQLSAKLKLSPEAVDDISTKVQTYQVHTDSNCRNCVLLELPSLETLMTRDLESSENSYYLRRFLDILLGFLRGLSDFGKQNLTVMEWLEHIGEERIEDQVINDEKFSIKLNNEVLDFVKDDYMLSMLEKWRDESPIIALYQYCISQSKFGYQTVLIKRTYIRDCFTHPFSSVLLEAENSTQTVEPVFGTMDLSKKLEGRDNNSTYYMNNHSEVSLAEFISFMDQRRFRIISSRPLQYVHTLPQSKLFFKRIEQQTENSYSVETERNSSYELIETMVSRYFKRINGEKIMLSELCIWYEVLPEEKSVEIFQVYSQKVQQVEQSDVPTVNGTDRLPKYILCSNADVLELRKRPKILKHSTVEYLSSEYKFMKVLLYLPLDNYEDLTEEVSEQLFEKLMDGSTVKLVEYNERLLSTLFSIVLF